ncbi:MAG: OmpA family protein [Oscillospiraceae bacterium]|nr:OmpA family protein [Oscillospiraceae bacterium]
MPGGDNRQDERGSGRVGEDEQEERTDGWMTTYADMVTLLMTFFVLMFAISNVDNQKAMLFFAGMSRDGLSATQFHQIVEMFNPGDDPGQIYIPVGGEWDTMRDERYVDDPEFVRNPEMNNLFERMISYIEESGLTEQINLIFDGEYLLVTLANDILFETGNAEVLPEMRYIAEAIARVLAGTHNPDNPFDIVVTGHTDNVPINTPQYPSNWDVSAARSLNFMRILLFESGIDPSFFASRGLGEYHPIASNDTAEGRRLNRRVEVQITIARFDGRHGALENLHQHED